MARSVTEIQADLTAHYAARSRALTPGYSLDTGQGRQSVTPINLSEINKSIRFLESELAAAQADADGVGGLDRVDFQRGVC